MTQHVDDDNSYEQRKKSGKVARDAGMDFERRMVQCFQNYFRDNQKKGVVLRLSPVPSFLETPGDLFVESADCRDIFLIIECKSRVIHDLYDPYVPMGSIYNQKQFEKLMLYAEWSGRKPFYAIELRMDDESFTEAYLVPAKYINIYYNRDRMFNRDELYEFILGVVRPKDRRKFSYALTSVHLDLFKSK